MEVLNRAIAIEEENNKNKPVKSMLLGRMYFCRATINQSDLDFTSAKKNYVLAKDVFLLHKEMQEAVTEIDT